MRSIDLNGKSRGEIDEEVEEGVLEVKGFNGSQLSKGSYLNSMEVSFFFNCSFL